MTKNKKLNVCTVTVYLFFLVLAIVLFPNDDPLAWILIFENGLIGILLPFILSVINATVKGLKASVIILPLAFGSGSLICSFSTWTIMAFKQSGVVKDLLNVKWDYFLLGFVSGLVGLAIGLAILGLKKLIKNNKAKKIESAEN